MTNVIQEKQYEIEAQIKELKKEALITLNNIIDLRYKKVLCLSDKFTTEQKNFGTKRKPEMHTVKLMHYEDYFSDDDTGETIAINRTRPVEIDGKMCDEWAREIEYLDEHDI